jgi:hypothetical protein
VPSGLGLAAAHSDAAFLRHLLELESPEYVFEGQSLSQYGRDHLH